MNKIVPQVTWGTSPEHVIAVTDTIPDPADAGDPDKQKATARRTLDHMGLKAGVRLDQQRSTALHRSSTNGRLSDIRCELLWSLRAARSQGRVRAWSCRARRTS